MLTVAFPEGRGLATWERRNAESPVPSRWPYGLDQLASNGVEVRTTEVPPPDRITRILSRLFGPRPRRGDGVVLAWDESTGARTLSLPAAKRYCGVIWATDQIARGDDNRHEIAGLRRALRALDGVWVLSRPQIEAVEAWLGPDSPSVRYVPFGVDTDFYSFAPFPDRPVVASVGGDRDRDAVTLFAALETVLKRRPDVECIVQTRADVVPPRGVSKVDHLPHDQVRRLFARSQVVAIATRPNLHVSGMTVALEAMSVGRPVVACSTPGMADYVLAGQTGQLVPPGDADEMARAILDLLADTDTAAQLGAQGRRHVETAHTTATMCRALADLVSAS